MASNDPKIRRIINDLLAGRESAVQDLSPRERQALIMALKAAKRGKRGLLEALWQMDFAQKPPTVDEFLRSKSYMGNICMKADGTPAIYPAWRQELEYILNPINEIGEWIIQGSIGTGKTWVAMLALFYRIMYLIFMRDPQGYYNLAPGSPIVFGLFNIFKYLAEDTSYKYFETFMQMSPFFASQGLSKDQRKSFIGFPHNIGVTIGAQSIHALGQNIYGGLMDEANFGRDHAERSQMMELYMGVRRRMESRFMQPGGSNPGLLCLVSSARSQGDFLDQHFAETAGDPHTHQVAYAIWDVKAELFKDSKRFYVLVGDRVHSSKIVDDPAAVPKDAKVITVPMEYRQQFEHRIDDAIRDIAGVATYGVSLLLPRRESLQQCLEDATPREHPFHRAEVALSIEPGDEFDLVKALNKEAFLTQYDRSNDRWKPVFYSDVGRCIHVDLARKGDCAGISMGGISEMRRIERFDNLGQAYVATDFVYFIDLALRIRAVPGSEIDFSKIRGLITYLRETGFNILQVSYDGFQSAGEMQELYKAGFTVKEISVDKKAVAYHTLRSVIMEGRFDMYHYQPFVDEIQALQDHSREIPPPKPPVDHPERGSKDVSDAVCGVVTALLMLKNSEAQGFDPKGMAARPDPELDPVERPQNWVAPMTTHPLNKLFED